MRSVLPYSPPLPMSRPRSLHSSSTSAVSRVRRLLRLTVAHQLDAEHQAHAAHLADERLTFLQFEEAFLQVRRRRTAGVLLDVLAVDDFERRQPLRHRDRVAAEGVEVDAVASSMSAISGRVTQAPSGAPLPIPLAIVTRSGVTPQFSKPQNLVARAAEAGLHLVGDAQPAVLADDVVDDLEILRRRRDGAADALDRLGDEAGDLAASLVADQRPRRRGHT